MYFQLEVDCYSNEANKNKYKNIMLIASKKNNLQIATDCTGHCTCNDNLSYFLLGLQSTLLLGLGVAWKYTYRIWKYIVPWKLCLFQQDISRSISIRYMPIKTNTLVDNVCLQIYPLLSTKIGVSLLHGGSCTKPSNCSDKIKMPKSTTGCRIKSFIPVENMNVEKLIDT